MGGRGASSGRGSSNQQSTQQTGPVRTAQVQQPQTAPQQPQQNTQSQQTPQQASNWMPAGGVSTYTLDQIKQLSDDELSTLVKASIGIDMPNHLADMPDATQNFVYAAGLNAPPTVTDDAGFRKFMAQNNIPKNQIMSRSVGGGTFNTTARSRRNLSDAQIAQMWISDPYNYIGGKHGGQVYGAGAYFDMNGGKATGYGGGTVTTYTAVLNPNTAKVIDSGKVDTQFASWSKKYPKTAHAINGMRGRNRSIKALVMGYNTISAGNGYYNVILRDAVVVKQ